ncbi:hypothetical protein [Pseudocnuella soli]|uniref:hypothetical protein n=1 Tax=Pseudocnuella soli TaxID=2502779 RepID=UPI0010535E3B|nr:hypothetical protein [Pseudocnuella soli]
MSTRFEEVHHSLDLDEDLKLHRKGWIAKPIGRAIIMVIVIAGALGFFGQGILSKKVLRQGSAMIQFDRFLRHNGEMDMLVSMTSVAGRSAVSFPLDYMQHLKVEHIVPQPEASFIRSGQVWYVFQTDQNLMAHFFIKPQTTGNLHGAVWINDQFIPISHFIYP